MLAGFRLAILLSIIYYVYIIKVAARQLSVTNGITELSKKIFYYSYSVGEEKNVSNTY